MKKEEGREEDSKTGVRVGKRSARGRTARGQDSRGRGRRKHTGKGRHERKDGQEGSPEPLAEAGCTLEEGKLYTDFVPCRLQSKPGRTREKVPCSPQEKSESQHLGNACHEHYNYRTEYLVLSKTL